MIGPTALVLATITLIAYILYLKIRRKEVWGWIVLERPGIVNFWVRTFL